MDSPETLAARFREKGLRWTAQRQAIAEALWGAKDHPTAEEIFRQVRSRHPILSRATVYNTMEALARVRQVETIQSEEGSRRYDPNTEPHHHLICQGCGRIDDLSQEDCPIRAERIEPTAGGFRVTGYRIEFHGLCPACQTDAGAGASDSRTARG